MTRSIDDILLDIEKLGPSTYFPPSFLYEALRDFAANIAAGSGDFPPATEEDLAAGVADRVVTASLLGGAGTATFISPAGNAAIPWQSSSAFVMTLSSNDVEMQTGATGIYLPLLYTSRILIVTNNVSISRALTWDATDFYFPGGTTLGNTEVAGAVDIFGLYCFAPGKVRVLRTADIKLAV